MPDKIRELVQFFYPEISEQVLNNFVHRIFSWSYESQAFDSNQVANLLAFCIPKEHSSEVIYRSHSFGVPCHCHENRENAAILEEVQRGVFNREAACMLHIRLPPQFRIFAPKLSKRNGTKIYLLSSHRQKRREIKERVRAMIRTHLS